MPTTHAIVLADTVEFIPERIMIPYMNTDIFIYVYIYLYGTLQNSYKQACNSLYKLDIAKF